MSSWTIIIASHAVAASVSLVLGPVQLIRRPKGDPAHRLIGRTWTVCMMFTAATSFFFGGWASGADFFLRALAVLTLVATPLGIVHARAGRIRAHARTMVFGYLGLVGAFIGVWAVPSRRVPSSFAEHPVIMSGIALLIIAVSLVFVTGATVRLRTSESGGPQRSLVP